MGKLKEKYKNKVYKELVSLNDGDNDNAIKLFQYVTGTDDTFEYLKENNLEDLIELYYSYKMNSIFASEFENFIKEKGFDSFEDLVGKDQRNINRLFSESDIYKVIYKCGKKKAIKIFDEFLDYYEYTFTFDPDCCPDFKDYINSEGSTILELTINFFIDIDDKDEVLKAFKKHNKEEYQEGFEDFKQEQKEFKRKKSELGVSAYGEKKSRKQGTDRLSRNRLFEINELINKLEPELKNKNKDN